MLRLLTLFISTLFLALNINASPTPTTNEIELRRRQNNDGNASTEAVKFWGWEGCSTADAPDGSNVILAAWDSLLDIANAVKDNIHFDGQAEEEFLGAKEKNTDYQVNIQAILENTSTWVKGGLLSWGIHMRCDDYKRGAITDPSQDCPPNTKKEDYSKCRSRCWRYYMRDGNPVWEGKAAAYTTNEPTANPVATINFCPSFFKMPTCDAAIARWGQSGSPQNRLDMFNYQCQGYAALHELFHFDTNSKRVSFKTGHVYDRRMKVKNGGKDTIISVYSPYYTKVMANWAGDNIGLLVATNADNLAQYSLAKYVQSKIGDYPKYPIVTKAPSSDPGQIRPYLLLNVDGSPTLPNATDIIKGLSLDTEDSDPANDDLTATQYSCSDADTDTSCIDDSTNPAVALTVDASMPTEQIATSTTCNCNENGCTADSPPCCANGTCGTGGNETIPSSSSVPPPQSSSTSPPTVISSVAPSSTSSASAPQGTTCNCTENGCSADSPACCANGTC